MCSGQSTLYCPVGLATLPAGLYAETVVDALEKANDKKKLYFYGSPKVSLGDTSFSLKYERSRPKFSLLASCYRGVRYPGFLIE